MGNSRVEGGQRRNLGCMHTDGTVVVAGLSDAREDAGVWVDWMEYKM